MKVEHIIMASLSMELGQQVMIKANGTEMWKYLDDTYEGKTNAATRTNQEIILFNKLQTAKCKPGWDVRQHVNGMFLIKAQLAALNADVRDPIFINMLMRSLPSNARFDRLRGLVEIGASEVDTPDKLKDQILRMDSYNKCDRELNATNASTAQAQTQQSGAKQKSQQQQNTGNNSATRQLTPEKAAAVAAKKLDKQQGNRFHCHRPGHLEKDCNKKISAQAPASGNKQATYTRRLGKSEQSESAQVAEPTSVTGVHQRPTSAPSHESHQVKIFQSTCVLSQVTRATQRQSGASITQPMYMWQRIADTSIITRKKYLAFLASSPGAFTDQISRMQRGEIDQTTMFSLRSCVLTSK
ncbi:hypothetical protein PI125_g24157 [Phytophthora idaei]|nr:hypothetical protein PI125_g24157 [Phytophthora idaei]KAG3127643.1 hypothetical protein PI126_g21758 [Phytophthora idaei]